MDYKNIINRDYKLTVPSDKAWNRTWANSPLKTVRPSQRHLIFLISSLLLLGTLISLLSLDARATRSDITATVPLASLSADAGEHLSSESREAATNAAANSLENPDTPLVTAHLPLPGMATSNANPETKPESPPETKVTRQVKVKSGDTLAAIFDRVGLSATQLANLGKATKPMTQLLPGEKLIFTLDQKNTLLELRQELSPVVANELKRGENGDYQFRRVEKPVETRIAYASGTINDSLFLAGQKAGLSDSLVMELAAIFGWDIDFALDIRQGDGFTAVYEERYLDGNKIENGAILAAEFVNRGKSYRALRYENEAGHVSYYSPEGLSLRKTFLRTPVEFSRISSRFNPNRKHPLLNRIRAHRGVDYAAPRGTPIRATGDGKVILRGKKGGYGRAVVIQHGSSYTTLYGHLSKFQRNVKRGSRVRQGQIIGYVGSSGLATGPHLHYEFRVNGVHRNPLTVKFPTAAPIDKRYRDDFKAKTATLVAQLEQLRRVQLAALDRGQLR